MSSAVDTVDGLPIGDSGRGQQAPAGACQVWYIMLEGTCKHLAQQPCWRAEDCLPMVAAMVPTEVWRLAPVNKVFVITTKPMPSTPAWWICITNRRGERITCQNGVRPSGSMKAGMFSNASRSCELSGRIGMFWSIVACCGGSFTHWTCFRTSTSISSHKPHGELTCRSRGCSSTAACTLGNTSSIV